MAPSANRSAACPRPSATPLFEREGVGLRITPAGARLLVDVTAALDQLLDEHAELLRTAQKTNLLISLSSTFASRWLIPRLPGFYAQHPDIQIEFLMGGRDQQPLSAANMFLTWDRMREWMGPRDLFHNCGDVEFGLVHSPVMTLPADRDYVLPQTGLIIDCATNGVGVALIERRLVEEELRDERLLAPYGFHGIEGGFGAFVPEVSQDKPSVKAFLDWLASVA